jgi:hypothetical protein
VKATLAHQQISEVPTTLAKDGRSRPPHLNTWRDGWRHLRFLLLFSPHWLFFVPGLGLGAAGLVIGGIIAARPLTIGDVTFDVDTLVVASALVVAGFQSVLFWIFARVYAGSEGFLPNEPYVQRVLAKLSLERGIVLGSIIGLAGLIGLVFSLTNWQAAKFGQPNFEHDLGLIVPSATALVVSCQLVFGTFFLSLLGIKQTRHMPIGAEQTRHKPIGAELIRHTPIGAELARHTPIGAELIRHAPIGAEAMIKVSDEPVTARGL